VREVATGRTRRAQANGDGKFNLGALSAGNYQVEVLMSSEKVTKPSNSMPVTAQPSSLFSSRKSRNHGDGQSIQYVA